MFQYSPDIAASEGISVNRMQQLFLEEFQADISHVEISCIVAVAFPAVGRKFNYKTKAYVYSGLVPIASSSSTQPQQTEQLHSACASLHPLVPLPSMTDDQLSRSAPAMQWNPSAGTGLQSLDLIIDWSQVEEVLVAELEALDHSECQSLLHGPLSQSDLSTFSVREIHSTFEHCSPCLWKLLGRLSTPHASAETSISATIATSAIEIQTT